MVDGEKRDVTFRLIEGMGSSNVLLNIVGLQD
jgi:hypothetical protein